MNSLVERSTDRKEMTARGTHWRTVYCHGLPGSAEEIEALVPLGVPSPHVLAPLDIEGFDQLMSEPSEPGAHVIGFSLGAMSAIRLAAQRPDKVRELTLIAPAAPLELGDFLPNMAGKPVFTAAKLGAIPFKMFTALQHLGVSVVANKIIQTMFAGSPAADMDLLSQPIFRAALIAGLKQSLGEQNKAYRQAIIQYVNPWAHILNYIKCPVTLHHGTEDNWAPIEMALALKREISADVELIKYPSLGHYSTLHKALPTVLSSSLIEL